MTRLPWMEGRSPGLLVSVRSAEEAVEAVRGGATVIDIKEPSRGPLGPADPATWRAVRAVVPPEIPVSVALGELTDWTIEPRDFSGIAFRKIGLAGSNAGWRAGWAEARRTEAAQTAWVAVAYADWERASAPYPDEVLDAAIEAEDCSGILIDTWDKTKPSPLAPSRQWIEWMSRAREYQRFVVLAGGLDCVGIERLAPLRPDLFAVRGAACQGNDRVKSIRADRVESLARLVESLGRSTKRS